MSVTMKQIAELAHVSRGTVDRVLNKRPGVNQETREKVQRIADELDYRPNMLGQALSQKQRKFTIAVITQMGGYYDGICEGLEAAKARYAEYGIDIVIHRIANKNVQDNLELLKEVCSNEKLNGLIFSPPNYPEIVDAVNHIIMRKIPIITLGSDLMASARLCYVGQDAYKSGRVAAELMGKLLDGKGQVLVTTLALSWAGLDDRVKGFCDKLAESYPDITVGDIHTELPDVAITCEKLVGYLNQYPDATGVLANIDYYGVLFDALQTMGRAARTKVIAYDMLPVIETGLQNGTIDFTILQNPFQQGFLSAQLMAEYLLFGKYPEKKFYFMPNIIYTKEMIC